MKQRRKRKQHLKCKHYKSLRCSFRAVFKDSINLYCKGLDTDESYSKLKKSVIKLVYKINKLRK